MTEIDQSSSKILSNDFGRILVLYDEVSMRTHGNNARHFGCSRCNR